MTKERNRYFAASGRLLLLMSALVVFGLSLYGTASAALKPVPPATQGLIASPGSATDDLDARIASDGKHLWFAKTFQDKKFEVFTQAFELRNGKWKSISGRLPSSNAAGVQFVAVRNSKSTSTPCMSYSNRKDKPRVRCYQGSRWHSKSLPRLASFSFTGMNATGRTATGLMGNWVDGVTTIQIVKLKGDRFVTSGPAFRIKGQYVWGLGQTTSDAKSGKVDVGLADLTPYGDDHWLVATLREGRWSQTKKLTTGSGSHISGPVRTGKSLVIPVNDSTTEKFWSMTAFSYSAKKWSQIGADPFSNGLGSAQGGTYAVGTDVWAIWNENDFSNVGTFGDPGPSWTFAARLNSKGTAFGKPIKLWHGDASFPGSVQAVEYRGHPVFLYSRQFKPYMGQETVDLSHR
ncbi:MAG: hypothetical protein JJE13_13110 [Thermoleophilia bacterium]|nr:hypothetical protein [Thermoleophilia bacterium]